MFDVITIGDATLDQFNVIDKANLRCDDASSVCQVCFDVGAKVGVRTFTEAIGGNAANVAVALQRLGLNAAIYTEIGSDDVGNKIKNQLELFSVDTRYVHQRKGFFSNHSTIVTYKRDRTIFVYHAPKKYELPSLDKSQWLYITSMSIGGDTIFSDIIKYVEDNNVQVVFGPGTYQLKLGLKKLKPLLALSTLYISNLEEAYTLFPQKEDASANVAVAAKKILPKIIAAGPQYAIITAGIKGAFGFDGTTFYKIKSFPATVVEKTGAGDSFSAGVLGAFFYRKSFFEALVWGSINAAQTMTKAGAQNGQLKKSEILKKIKENSSFLTKRY